MSSIITTTDGRQFLLTDEGQAIPVAEVAATPQPKPATPKGRKPAATPKPQPKRDAATRKPRGKSARTFTIRPEWKNQRADSPEAARMLTTCLRYKLVKPAEVGKLSRYQLAERITASMAASK